jgi:hypothetical protein
MHEMTKQTIFSSDLVESRENTDPGQTGTHFVAASQFWLYVVITIPMVALTLASTLWLERTWSKSLVVPRGEPRNAAVPV